MHRVLLLLLACGLTLSAGARAEGPWQESYADAAEVARIYGAAAEELSPRAAGELLLELVNAERAAQGLSRLEFSAAASTLALAHAEDMAGQGYVNHYDLKGRKCELRFNAQGETDHVAENVSYYEIGAPVFLTEKLVRRIHDHWMGSRTHRANVLEPGHTHMGYGFSIVRRAQSTLVAAVQEFVNDYGVYTRLPLEARAGSVLQLRGRLDPGVRLLSVGLGSEDLPFERTVEYQLRHIGGYSPPDVALALLPTQYEGNYEPAARYREYNVVYDRPAREFTVNIELKPHWPAAAYYVTVWVQTSKVVRPFPAMTQVVLVR
jgi:uncharacterized protein YkwD